MRRQAPVRPYGNWLRNTNFLTSGIRFRVIEALCINERSALRSSALRSPRLVFNWSAMSARLPEVAVLVECVNVLDEKSLFKIQSTIDGNREALPMLPEADGISLGGLNTKEVMLGEPVTRRIPIGFVLGTHNANPNAFIIHFVNDR